MVEMMIRGYDYSALIPTLEFRNVDNIDTKLRMCCEYLHADTLALRYLRCKVNSTSLHRAEPYFLSRTKEFRRNTQTHC